MAPRWRFTPRWRLDGVSIVPDVGPQADDVGDELLGHTWKYDTGERLCEAQSVRLRVALPAAGSVDPLEV